MQWHIITCEYPPLVGGVSDHTRLIAEGLVAAGDRVHVWSPPAQGEATAQVAGVTIRRELGGFGPGDLRRIGRALDEFAAPRRLLVQWVPHGYGYRSMNIWFCLWLWARAFLRGDEVDLIVHEPFLAFREGSRRQDAVAFVHRLMTITLLRAARRIWVTIPRWEKSLRPYTLGRRVTFGWLPVPSTAPALAAAGEAAATRALYSPRGGMLVGHFGTYGKHIAAALSEIVPRLLSAESPSCAVLLIGRGSEALREELLCAHPHLAGRLSAAGLLPSESLSRHLAACDLLVQPYPDGVSTRRTSVMAGLAHGLPVVTTRGPLTEDLWEESGAVTLTRAGDMQAMVTAVRELLADVGRRRELSEAARQMYELYFDMPRLMARLRQSPAVDSPAVADLATPTIQ